MRGHEARAKQALMRRGRWRQRGIDVYTGFIQLLGNGERWNLLICIDGDDGHDIAVRRTHLDAALGELSAQIQGVVLQRRDKFRMLL